jgi:hypothetical protein
MHGGASLVGIASATFKHGRYSKHLPSRLAGRYAEALADPQLLELRDEIALIGTRQSELLTHLASGNSLQRWQEAKSAYEEVEEAIAAQDALALRMALNALANALHARLSDYAGWREIMETTELRRRLVESENRRLVQMQQTLTVEQTMALLAAVTDIIRRKVDDPHVLAEIAAALRGIVSVGVSQQPES